MATIADLIVAVAAARTLRVAVGCTRADASVFADEADETDLCRVNIQLSTPDQVTAPDACTHSAADGQDPGNAGGQEPDIIVDYLHPGSPAIRHLGPVFATPTAKGRPAI